MIEKYQVLQNISLVVVLVAVIIGGLGSYGWNYYGKKITELKGIEQKKSSELTSNKIVEHLDSSAAKIIKHVDKSSKEISKAVKMAEKKDIVISNNSGNVVIGGSNNTQIINQQVPPRRVIRQPAKIEEGFYNDGSGYVVRITMDQTEGTWPDGEYFHLQLQLSGPYQQYKFLSGYNNMAYFDWTVSNEEGQKIGWFEWKTITPPKKEPIVLEISSVEKIKVVKILLSPAEPKP